MIRSCNIYSLKFFLDNQEFWEIYMVSSVRSSSVHPTSYQLTPTKVCRVGLYALSMGSIAVPGLFFYRQADQSIDAKFAFTASASLVSSLGFIALASSLKDYRDIKELRGMKKQAQSLSFDELVKTHGFENIIKYALINPELLEQKFRKKCELGLSFIIKKYPFSKIIKHNVVSKEILHELFYKEMKGTSVENLDKDFLQESCVSQVISEEEMEKLGAYRDYADAAKQVFENECIKLEKKYFGRQLQLVSELKFHEKTLHKDRKMLEMLVLGIGGEMQAKYTAEYSSASELLKKDLKTVQERFEDQLRQFSSRKES